MKNTSHDVSRAEALVEPVQASRLAWTLSHLRSLGPYVALELIMPGGTLMAALFWLYRQWRSSAATPTINPLQRPISILKVRWSRFVSSIRGRRSRGTGYSGGPVGGCCNGG